MEIIFACFIFASLVTMLSGIWVLHARAQRQTGMLMVAGDLADLEMNRALAQGYHDVEESQGSYSQIWEVRGQQITHVFEAETEVFAMLGSNGSLPMKLVRVTVTYEDPESTAGSKAFSMDSVLTDEG